MPGRENLHTNAHRLREQISTTLNYTAKGQHPQSSDFALAYNDVWAVPKIEKVLRQSRRECHFKIFRSRRSGLVWYQCFVKWRHRLKPENKKFLIPRIRLKRGCTNPPQAAAACVAARVIDTMYQLIYSSAQTRAWRIEFSYRYIREYKARSKGRVRDAASRIRPFDRALYSSFANISIRKFYSPRPP
jgi:hypothetical protein